MIAPITYPIRPINIGPLPTAPPLPGEWYWEPKYNGWRALVHVPTGTMFNRKGKRLSINGEFNAALELLKACPFEWLDCEALERRHKIGRGSLIVLDAVTHGDCFQRRCWLDEWFKAELGPLFIDQDTVYRPPMIAADVAASCWEKLQLRNKDVGCTFYEGLVGKRADSLYPIQLRSPDEEFSGWVKSRWKW